MAIKLRNYPGYYIKGMDILNRALNKSQNILYQPLNASDLYILFHLVDSIPAVNSLEWLIDNNAFISNLWFVNSHVFNWVINGD